ncbi:MAG: hypothetical protein U0992_21715 [Planctomycetaceae bacterium]
MPRNKIQDLRDSGRFSDAVRLLIRRLDRLTGAGTIEDLEQARRNWAQYVSGENCLVLEGLHKVTAAERVALSRELLNSSGVKTTAGGGWRLLKGRLGLLSLLDSSEAATVERVLRKFVTLVGTEWNHNTDLRVRAVVQAEIPVLAPDTASRREPSFMTDLPGELFKTAFRTVAADVGWMHPGLLLAGETRRPASNVRCRKQRSRLGSCSLGTTHNGPTASGQVDTGTAPRRLRRPDPDARACGYVRMDRTFSDGLQAAWFAAATAASVGRPARPIV